MFQAADPKQQFSELEARILSFWQQNEIFEKSLSLHHDGPLFVFHEGPPTANGLPGVHHVLARSFKDVIPRYKTMRGFRVPRRAGWDCHGLPVEVEVEKRLGLKGKQQIEAYGVAAFNEQCRQSTLQYIEEWNRLTQRIGFWLDTKNPYRTLDNAYIESCWALLQVLWKKGLLKEDYKITKHCPRCETSLAEAEAGQGMKEDVEDPAVTVRLKLVPGQKLPGGSVTETETSFLIWTTTPWTLPANAAVALNPTAMYAVCSIKQSTGVNEHVILLQNKVVDLLGEEAVIIQTATGDQFAGLRYEPLYEGRDAKGQSPLAQYPNVYKSVADTMVSSEEGTGIVHLAPAYGDLDAGRTHKLPVLFSVGLDGLVLPTLKAFAGTFFKDADPLIIRDLKQRGLLLKQERIRHTYPFCWRCDTPLLYFAKTNWYITTTARKEEMLTLNQTINWIPEHIKEGRFGDWLRNNVDWAISRQRYWGTPLPLWQCDGSCGIQTLVGSVSELSQYMHREITDDEAFDLHRPYVDGLTWTCQNAACGGTFRRIKDVIDCWFDSGAMPYAQEHAHVRDPSTGIVQRKTADFICEAVDQTRGWFYTLHALSTLISDDIAFKNCMVLGHILDENGQKMSKRLGNIVNPWSILDSEGADALRYCLYTSSPPGQPRRFSQNLVQQGLRQFLIPLWNCYSFFSTYAESEYSRLKPEMIPWRNRPIIDQWMVGKLHRLIREMTLQMDAYDVTTAIKGVSTLVDDLSNWYIRRNRDRFWSQLDENDEKYADVEFEKRAAYQTLRECLVMVARLSAPFIPFLAEELWQKLERPVETQAAMSVHLSSWPEADTKLIAETEQLSRDMELAIRIVNLGRSVRVENSLKVRQPLAAVTIQLPLGATQAQVLRFEREIREELNVESVTFIEKEARLLDYTIRPNLPVLGKKYGAQLKEIKQALEQLSVDTRRDFAIRLLEGENILLTNLNISLAPTDVLLGTLAVPGLAAKADAGLVVALSTEITPELKEKGVVRELVRAIGDLRKRANYNVAQRVHLFYVAAEQSLAELLVRHTPYLRGETLVDIRSEVPASFDAHAELVLEEGAITLFVKSA